MLPSKSTKTPKPHAQSLLPPSHTRMTHFNARTGRQIHSQVSLCKPAQNEAIGATIILRRRRRCNGLLACDRGFIHRFSLAPRLAEDEIRVGRGSTALELLRCATTHHTVDFIHKTVTRWLGGGGGRYLGACGAKKLWSYQ